ncbi:hypothetical protein CB0940_00210 [Cercospora beticola]|uniref:Uncharacterized protein n=1 Tax=Cercospora beticola TaxID=122368 RepID=A0A2G5IBE0_CERBT|nr:hypothetical protein CB0940_00210 [Cercospora beticola]PIB02105.1 hypothetical protein CB0940_00210 [Cercospora beticola]CAK1356150.1 unnamed protein product [Cercospora beticola]
MKFSISILTTVLMAFTCAHARPADYKHGNTIWERSGTPDPDRGGSKKICTDPLNRSCHPSNPGSDD